MGCPSSKSRRKTFRDCYELGDKLGFGAFAQVRICTEKKTGTCRAVKLICKPYPEDDIELELKLLSKVSQDNCPNIVHYYELFQDVHFYYMVMEYCRGGQLFERIHNDSVRICERDVCSWMKQILEGIHHLHKLGIVHRDVKPQNILFSDGSYKRIKLIDFGLSFALEQNRLIDEPCGTAEFVAPEMILGKYGRKVDIWSCGIILYLILFGKLPFSGNSNQEIFRSVVECDPQWSFDDVQPPKGAVDLCKQLLVKNFTQRPMASIALEHPWIKGTLQHPGHSGAVMVPDSVRKRLRRYSILGREPELSSAEWENKELVLEKLQNDYKAGISVNKGELIYETKNVEAAHQPRLVSILSRKQSIIGFKLFSKDENNCAKGGARQEAPDAAHLCKQFTRTQTKVAKFKDDLNMVRTIAQTDSSCTPSGSESQRLSMKTA